MQDFKGEVKRIQESKAVLQELESLLASKEDVLRYPDKVKKLTTEDKWLLTEFIIVKFSE